MRDVNIVKYRKLLAQIQDECSHQKQLLYTDKRCNTDHQRGVIQGKHAAYNDVIKMVHDMIWHAESDWNYMHCRDEEL